MSWSWRKLLQIRPLVPKHLWHILGDARNTSAWYDTWADCCPIIESVTHRMINSVGYDVDTKVAGIVANGVWSLPSNWDQHILSTNVPLLQENKKDVLNWRTNAGTFVVFSVSLAWNDLRVRASGVEWYHLVWYNQRVPKYSFLLWLVFKKKLKTQDVLHQWDTQHSNLPLVCPFCNAQHDSHTHLFFDCFYSSRVWREVNIAAGLNMNMGAWDDIVHDLLPIANRNSFSSVVSKLVLASTVYTIWQEMNDPSFKKSKRTEIQVAHVILSNVRLKLMTLRFKKNKRVEDALLFWKLPHSLIGST